MTLDRLRQIEELFHAARERSPEERAELLARVDPELPREVESLLSQPSADRLLGGQIIQAAAAQLVREETVTVLTAGTCLGPYRIESKLGEGGMGEVYRALDTRLGRAVAIKVSHQQFSARFEREARAISSLNHPHICTLYDVGPNYLVMELVQGETLTARLKKGSLSNEVTLRIGAQIAAALAEAHQKGIIHRDLKPGNIMVTKAGIKVLDFGLAKSVEDETLTAGSMVMGTPAYMAPEQRAGGECDARTDIYALGLVLHEMATGKRPPLDGPAPMESLPANLAHVIQRCLERDPNRRWQTVRDVELELEWLAALPADVGRRPVAPPRSARTWIAIAAVLAIALAVLAILHFRATPLLERSARFQITLPGNTAVNQIHLSPNGRYLAIAATGADGARLWVRPLDSLQARALPGTEGASFPFWSPDNAFIGFFAQGKLKKIALTGGPAQTLCDAPVGRGGTWNGDGVIVFAPTNAGVLYRVPAAGGVPAPVTKLTVPSSQEYHRFPEFLRRRFLYEAHQGGANVDGIYAGSLDGARPVRILPNQSNAAYVSSNGSDRSGRLLFRRGDSLMARPFDAERLRLSGEMFPVAEQVGPIVSLIGSAAFSASENGALAYWRGGYDTRELVWLDRTGKRLAIIGKPARIAFGWLSPEDKRVVFAISDPATTTIDIWLSLIWPAVRLLGSLSAASTSLRFGFRTAVASASSPAPQEQASVSIKSP